jgi:hypothetical protein
MSIASWWTLLVVASLGFITPKSLEKLGEVLADAIGHFPQGLARRDSTRARDRVFSTAGK